MQIIRIILATVLLALPNALSAHAASSEWHHVEGGSVRLVTSGIPDAEGRLRGALEIRLKPGWKTYWRDPGSSGVPPTLDATIGGVEVPVEIDFPEPQRFEDDYAPWAGYDRTVSLALTFGMTADDGAFAPVEASAFLGVCETICIPVQAQLRLEPARALQKSDDEITVDAAFQALPERAGPELHARPARLDGKALTIEAATPEGVEVLDIFVAGTQTLTLGTPSRIDGGERPAFVVPLHGKTAPGDELLYTLVTSAGAVTGTLKLP